MKNIWNSSNLESVDKLIELNKEAYDNYVKTYSMLEKMAVELTKTHNNELRIARDNYKYEFKVELNDGYFHIQAVCQSELHPTDIENEKVKVKTLVIFKVINYVVIYHESYRPFYMESLINGSLLNESDMETLMEGNIPVNELFNLRKEWFRYGN